MDKTVDSLDTQNNNVSPDAFADMSSRALIDVSIIIPAKNEAMSIGKVLEMIRQQETAYHLEIIVIDSGSTDDTLSIVNRCIGKENSPAIKLVSIAPEEFGHGRTRNMGAEMARGRFVVFLNADAVPINHQWLDSLIQPLEDGGNRSNPQLAGVFSRHIPADDCDLYMVRDLLASMPAEGSLRTGMGQWDTMLFSTVSAAMKKEIWEKYPFAADIIIAEDQEWARRMLNEGFAILYEPMSMVRHSHNYTPSQLYDSKQKIAQASGRFGNKFTAIVIGFILMVGGFLLKALGDSLFILFKPPVKRTLMQKLKDIRISLIARMAGFWGHYTGWLKG